MGIYIAAPGPKVAPKAIHAVKHAPASAGPASILGIKAKPAIAIRGPAIFDILFDILLIIFGINEEKLLTGLIILLLNLM